LVLEPPVLAVRFIVVPEADAVTGEADAFSAFVNAVVSEVGVSLCP
jgi:hypothetical protein